MKITVKVNAKGRKAPASVVRDRLKASQPKAVVEEVFPGVRSGRRAGMVIVNLPDDVSDEESETLLTRLRDDEEIEYAEPARSRKRKRNPD